MFKPGLRFRKQLLIDHRVQIPILQRMGFYMIACAVYFMVVLFWAESTSYGHESFSRTLTLCFDVMICWAPGVMLLAPIIAYDILIFTNKFAGPMFRLRREMQCLVEGKSTNPVHLRTDDCWPEMAVLFNEIQAELIELRAATAPKTKVLFDPNKANSEEILISEDSTAEEPTAEAREETAAEVESQPTDQPETEQPDVEEPTSEQSATELEDGDDDIEKEAAATQAAESPSDEARLATAE